MKEKNPSSGTLRAYLIAFPVVLVNVASLGAILFRLIWEDAAWPGILAWGAVGLAAVNPGVWLLLVPLLNYLSKAAGGYLVRGAVTAEGVGRDTLDRCAAIAEANAKHPVAACLRAHCGDVAAPPDKFVEMEGLGASARFSGQMIHAGSAAYLRGLKIDVPDLPGRTVHVALEGRLLGYYRLLGPPETASLKKRLRRAVAVCAALKLTVWAVMALTGTAHLTVFVGCETASLVAALIAARPLSS